MQGLLACGFLALILIGIAFIERLAVPAATALSTTLGRLGFHALCFFALFLQPHDLRRRGEAAITASQPQAMTGA